MNTRRKSTLFLVEQLIVVAVFAICAAACVSILTSSFFMANNSNATSNALIAAQNCAETFKATSGDFNAVASFLGTTYTDNGDTVTVYYDKQWKVCSEANASFMLVLKAHQQIIPYGDGTHGFPLTSGEITVSKTTGEILVEFPIAVRG